MASKKSALTAALSGAPPALGQEDAAAHPKDDVFAFPCLAEGGISDADAAAAGFEKLNLERRSSLAGSAPTAPRMSGTMASFSALMDELRHLCVIYLSGDVASYYLRSPP